MHIGDLSYGVLKKHGQVLCAAVYSGEVFRTIFATVRAGFRSGVV